MSTRNQKPSDLSETPGRKYQAPKVVSMTSTDLLELLGPAQGYGGAGGRGSSNAGDPSAFVDPRRG